MCCALAWGIWVHLWDSYPTVRLSFSDFFGINDAKVSHVILHAALIQGFESGYLLLLHCNNELEYTQTFNKHWQCQSLLSTVGSFLRKHHSTQSKHLAMHTACLVLLNHHSWPFHISCKGGLSSHSTRRPRWPLAHTDGPSGSLVCSRCRCEWPRCCAHFGVRLKIRIR